MNESMSPRFRGRVHRAVRTATLLSALGGLAACGSAPTGPQVVDVGQVHLVMPLAGWKTRDLPKSEGRVSSSAADYNDRYDMPTRMLRLPQRDGRGTASLFVVRTAPGIAASGRGVVADAHCRDPEAGSYLADLSGSPTSPSCVRAWNHLSPKDLFDKSAAALGLGDTVKVVKVDTMNSRAAQVSILAVLPQDFVGKASGVPQGTVPAGFPADLAAWADALGRAARGATNSFSGTLVVPPGVFE